MNLSFAILGCGRVAKRHAEQVVKIGNLAAVCDTDEERATDLAAGYGGKVYTSLETLLLAEPSVDVVAICTPNGLHAEHSIECLQHHKHVLCEMPLCISNHDAKTMVETANQADTKLFVVKQNRYNPPVVAVKKLINEDRLGKILSFQVNCFWNRPMHYYTESWRGTRLLDGGTLYTQFSHFIDLLFWLLGDVKEVQACIKNYEHRTLEIEDTGVVLIETLGGAIGTLNYTVNCYDKNMEGSFTIFAEKGTVKIGGQYLNELEYQSIDGNPIDLIPGDKMSNTYGYYQANMSHHDKVYENLVKALNNPGYEFASALEGMKTVEIIEKIYAAAGLR